MTGSAGRYRRSDFFISYAGRDRAWAEWVAWQLEHAEGGAYTVELDVWDWPAGRNYVAAMSQALMHADRVLALLSNAYFDSSYCSADAWTDALVKDEDGEDRLLPVRIDAVVPPPLIRSRVLADLSGVDESTAIQRLMEAARGPRRPDGQPAFPGRRSQVIHEAGPRLPGSLPPVWNVPAANPDFVGRDGILVELRQRLVSGGTATIQVLHGMGGVGKTQLAIEYAHRHGGAYDLVWWVNSGQPTLIRGQLENLALTLGESRRNHDGHVGGFGTIMRRIVGDRRWLLILDNLQAPADISWYRPDGRGHILITSRNPAWHEAAARLEVGVFGRQESINLLKSRAHWLADADSDRLADALGDLPLALAQAGSLLADTGMPADEYLSLLRTQARLLLGEARILSYPLSLAASWLLALDRLREEDPAAAQLLQLVAFLGAEPVPLDMVAKGAKKLGGKLATAAESPLTFRRTVAHISRYGMARISGGNLQLHRLVQAVLRDHVESRQRRILSDQARMLLSMTDPGDPEDPASWRYYEHVLPHLLATNLVNSDAVECRSLLMNTIWYTSSQRSYEDGYRLARQIYARWKAALPSDDYYLSWARNQLARAERSFGNFAAAQALDEEALAICRRSLGNDHPDTLTSANNVAVDLSNLGEHERARQLDADTLSRRRRVLGGSHPHTLGSANNLAVDLSNLARHADAYRLCEDTLARCETELGDNHPLTLMVAGNLAHVLSNWGEYEAARELDEDTLERRRRILGEDHPLTLATATNLAHILSCLGDHEAARELDQDTLLRRRRVLGDSHPQTIASANDLIQDLTFLGHLEEADNLTKVVGNVGRNATQRPRPQLRRRRYERTAESASWTPDHEASDLVTLPEDTAG